MIDILVLGIMATGAYVGFREGLFTSFCMLVNVFVAGLVAFGFFEVIADNLENVFKGSVVLGYEDFFSLVLSFALVLIVLRVTTNNLANRTIDFPAKSQQFGGAAIGLLAGYFTAGFCLCALQTLPWHENFLGFEPRSNTESEVRSVYPPDRAWLTLMRFGGAHGLSWKVLDADVPSRYDRFQTFDRNATFELRYQRYRRYHDQRPPMPYQGELDTDLDRKK